MEYLDRIGRPMVPPVVPWRLYPHRPSLVSGFLPEPREMESARAGDFDLTWRVEALAGPAHPSGILGETAPRRLHVKGWPGRSGR